MLRPTFSLGRAVAALAVPVTLVGSGALVWRASYSAFSATTATGSNSWTTGTVDITSDQTGSVLFNIVGITPDGSRSALSPGNTGGAYTAGSTLSGGSKCIKVTYQGSVTADVRVYGTVAGTDAATLGAAILFTIDAVDGVGAANPTCSSYPTGSSYVYGTSGTTTASLYGLPANYGAANTTAWQNAANGNSKWYRLSWLYPSTVTGSSGATQNVTATITWEAHSV